MKRFRRLSPEAAYRSARSLVWINGTGMVAFLVLAGIAVLRHRGTDVAVPIVYAAVWACLTAIALWRMRRARRAAKVVELFSSHA